jgi:spermidine synthase
MLGALSIIVGVIALLASRPGTDSEVDVARTDFRLMATVVVTGLLAIGFEIIGVRVLSQVMENTVYSFAAALAVYLLGTSVGAALYHRFGREELLNDLLGAMPVVCLGAVFVLSKAQFIYNGLRSAFGDSAMGVMAAEMMLALGVFLLPTMMMGAIFSVLMQRQPAQLSKLLALNTFGSALAPIVFGVLLLPAIGSKWALVLVSAGYFALVTRWRWLMPVVAVGMVLLLPKLQFVQVPPGGTLADYREGVMASVAVVRDAAGDRTLKVDNRFQMGGTSASATEYRQAHFPLQLHGKPQRALFLGTGTGITFGAATLYPHLEADGVELLPEIVDVMHHFKPENFLDKYDNRLHMDVADARRFVRTTRHSYDVIVADLFHPARDGAATLYTKEHFTAIRSRLNPGGIFCQWLPLHQMDETMLRIVIRTFLEMFPNVHAYLLHWSVDVPVLGLIGTEQWPAHGNRVTGDTKVSGGFIAGPDALRRFSVNASLNTDDHQVLTYAAARFVYRHRATSYDGLLTALGIEGPPTDFLKARNVYLQGLIHETEGRLPKAIEYYLESVRISDSFTMGYSRCISLAAAQAKDRPDPARALLQRLVDAKPKEKLAQDLLERLFPEPQK